jgi:hypothetical protein
MTDPEQHVDALSRRTVLKTGAVAVGTFGGR